MKVRNSNGTRRFTELALLAVLFASAGVSAQERGHGGFAGPAGAARVEHAGPGHEHIDARYAHNRPYFNRGYTVHDAPRTGYLIHHGRDRYWYDGGEWYLAGDLGWTVVDAPFGAFVSDLPPYYTTLTIDGVTYYYANDTYYVWDANDGGYEVVPPPDGSEPTDSD